MKRPWPHRGTIQALCYKSVGRGFDSDEDTDVLFSAPILSSCTMATGFTQPLTDMNTRRYLGVKRGQSVGLTKFPPCVG
jgi:hypothetical protein